MSVSCLPGARGGGEPREQQGTAGWHRRQPRSTSLLSPHLHDVSEIAIALTHPLWQQRPQRRAQRPASPDRCGGQTPPAGLARLTGKSIKAQGMGRVSWAGSSSALLFRSEGARCIPGEGWGEPRARCCSALGLLLGARHGRDLLPLRTSGADIPSNTSAGEIKQSSRGGPAGQEPARNIPAHSQALQ